MDNQLGVYNNCFKLHNVFFIMVGETNPEYGEIFDMRYWKDPVHYMHHRIANRCPSFNFADVESFKVLFDKKILIPGITILRIDDGSIGGHYRVQTRDSVEGLCAEAYSGRPGIHSVASLINECPEWSPNPIFFPDFPERTLMEQCRILRTVEDIRKYLSGEENRNTEAYLKELMDR